MKITTLLVIFLSFEILADKAQCDRYLAKIKDIQQIQFNFSSPVGSVGSLQENYDQQIAKLTILKGIRELKDDYIRNRGSLLSTLPNLQNDDLEKDIASSTKLLSLEDLMDEMEEDQKLQTVKTSDDFIRAIEKKCKEKNSTLCEDLPTVEPMVRGFSTSVKIQNNTGTIKEYRNFLQEDLPSRDDRKKELDLKKKTQEDLQKLKKCLSIRGETCDKELSSLKTQVSQIETDSLNLEKNMEELNLRDSYGDMETLIDAIALQIKEKEQGKKEPSQTEILNNLNKRIKKNFEIANLRAQIRGKKYEENMPPVITEKNAPTVLKEAFLKIGCSSKDLNQCLEKLSNNSNYLDKEIAKLESSIEDTVKKLNNFTSKINYKKMEEMKAILISLAQEECREEKVKGVRAFTPCTTAQDNASPNKPVTGFAISIGRAIAEVEPNLFVHKDSTQMGRKFKLNQLCRENFTLVGSRFSSGDLCANVFVTEAPLTERIKEKITGKKTPVKGQCGPAPYCMDWMSFYKNYDIERDDSGKILYIKKGKSWSDMIAPELAKSVLTIAPVGLEMYQSDQYLKIMQNQAAYQLQVNHYRKNYPLHTYMWDRGYRGFNDGYIGGPTLKNPGVTGFGALGNPYAGEGAWNPYGLSGVLPYQLGMYSYNPYFNGNFQFGSTYTFNQLSH